MEKGNEIYVKIMDNYGLSKIRRTITIILDEFQIKYDKRFKPSITIKEYCGNVIEKNKRTQFLGEQIIKRIHIVEEKNHKILDCFKLIPQSILIGRESHEEITKANNIQLKRKMIELFTMKLLYALLESNSINLDRC